MARDKSKNQRLQATRSAPIKSSAPNITEKGRKSALKKKGTAEEDNYGKSKDFIKSGKFPKERIEQSKQVILISMFEMLIADFFLRLSMFLNASHILLFETESPTGSKTLLVVYHTRFVAIIIILFTMLVAGWTDSRNKTVLVCLYSCAFGFATIILSIVAEVLYETKLEQKGWIFYVVKYLNLYAMIFEPARIIIILDILQMPKGYQVLRFTCASLLWFRELAFITNFGILMMYKDLPFYGLMSPILSGCCLVGYVVIVYQLAKRRIFSSPERTNVVGRMLNCLCESITRKLNSYCKKSNSLLEDTTFVFSTPGYSEQEKYITYAFITMFFCFSAVLIYYLVSELLIVIWDFQLRLLNRGDETDSTLISSTIVISAMNLFNIPLAYIVLLIFRRFHFLFLNDLRIFGAAYFALLIAVLYTFISQTQSDTLPRTIGEGRAQMIFYNALTESVSVDSSLTGSLIIDKVSSRITTLFRAQEYVATLMTVSTESFNYTKTVFALEKQCSVFLITYLGLVRITGYDIIDTKPESVEPTLAKLVIMNGDTYYSHKVILKISETESIEIALPQINENKILYVRDSRYVYQDQQEPWQEWKVGGIYAMIFYKANSSALVWQYTFFESSPTQSMVTLAIFFISLAKSIAAITIMHFVYSQSPLPIRNLMFSIIIFYEVVGSGIFYLSTSFSTMTPSLIAVFVCLYFLNGFYFAFICSIYQHNVIIYNPQI